MSAPETRSISLVDLPWLRRLSAEGLTLDSAWGLTRDWRSSPSPLLTALLFSRGMTTFVSRTDQQRVVGQFRYKPEDLLAHITYLAPYAIQGIAPDLWWHLLDALAREAGKQGAHALVAELDLHHPLFEVMRQARYAVYVRQTLWRYTPTTRPTSDAPLMWHEESTQDQIGVMALFCQSIPTMLQQIAAPSHEGRGWVVRQAEQVVAHLHLYEGSHAVFGVMHLHPSQVPQAQGLIAAALDLQPRLPFYMAVRSYQEALIYPLEKLGFEMMGEQAILVKHLTAGVRQTTFARLKVHHQLEAAHTALPQRMSCPTIYEDVIKTS